MKIDKVRSIEFLGKEETSDFIVKKNHNFFCEGILTHNSGHGKGTASESLAERWKKTTKGVVIFLNDPKLEAEQSYVMYEPEERYHLNALRKDGIKKNRYTAKLYHPYTHNLAKKGFLPEINFYTLSIKDMTKGDWSILAESDAESETIKLLERVSEDLPRNSNLFDFLHEIERLTEGKKNRKKAVPDPQNYFLSSGGGTAKSVKQIGNMLSSFKTHYFLRKDTCDLKLDWEKILLDNENYHVFLSNWINNPKLRNFLVEVLLGQAVLNAQRLANLGKLKEPILFIIPELINVCPAEDKGSSMYLAKALRKHLVAMRSQAGGMSCIADTQIWSGTSAEVRSAFNQTFFGKLNPEDARIIFKANSYTASQRDYFKDIEEYPGSFLWHNHEDNGIFSIFMPSHMHKEVRYNWIQMYKKHYGSKMKRYDNLVNSMKKEYEEEFNKAKEEAEDRLYEEEEKEDKKEKKTKSKVEKEVKKDSTKEYLEKRAWQLLQEGLSYRKIGEELLVSGITAKKYCERYEKSLVKNPEDIKPNIGFGVMPEEIESNFNNDNIDSE